MFIDDEELRFLYRDASQEHLDKLEAGMLRLEKQPEDMTPLNELLREAHSLKGDSRMLGVLEAETLTHHVEDLLIAVDQGQMTVTAELCDRIYTGLDAIRKVAQEAVTNQPANIVVSEVVAKLTGGEATPIRTPETDEMSSAIALEENTILGNLTDLEIPAGLDFSELALPPEATAADLDHDVALPESEPEAAEDYDFSTPHIPEGLDLSKLDPELVAALTGTAPTPASDAEPAPAFLEESSTLIAELEESSTLIAEETKVPPAEVAVTQQPSTPVEDERYHIDTVRVAADKLDHLMNQAGELAVTKSRITRRLEDLTQLLNQWEAWSRAAYINRALIEEWKQHLPITAGVQLQAFHQHHEQQLEQLGDQLNQLRNVAYEDTARLESVAHNLEGGILKLRMLPLSTLFNLFPRMIRDLAKQQGKQVNLIIEGGETLADKRILEEMKAPLTHLLRNAIDHGIETPGERLAADKPTTATLKLRGYQSGDSIGIELEDDGQGLNLGKIKRTAIRRKLYTPAELERMDPEQIQSLIFAPGFSTRTTVTELSGRGVGLDVVRANVERLKGTIQVHSVQGQGCQFQFTLGNNLTTANALIVTAAQSTYALPLEFVDRMLRIDRQDIFTIEGKPVISHENQPISVAWLADLLDLDASTVDTPHSISKLICVVLRVGTERLGLLVDELLEQQPIVLKPQSKLLRRVRNIAGATILGNGDVCMVLNAGDLLQSAGGRQMSHATEERLELADHKLKVLLVEDSVPIRTQMRRILQGAGYDVTAAVDGLDGYNKLELDTFDAVVSDVEMPNLDGLGLTSRIREQQQYEDLPIILVTTLAKDEDKQRGADAGANAYLTKGDFDQSLLLNTLRRLI